MNFVIQVLRNFFQFGESGPNPIKEKRLPKTIVLSLFRLYQSRIQGLGGGAPLFEDEWQRNVVTDSVVVHRDWFFGQFDPFESLGDYVQRGLDLGTADHLPSASV